MSTQSGQFVYDLPIVSTDLRPEETIHQICDSLIYLKRVSKDVFDRINDRIAESRNKLADINNRIDTARTKIEALKGVNKATKVFSSAKYPSANDDATYNRIYTSTMSVNMERKQVKINSMSAPPGDEILRDKLKSFDSPMHLNVRVKRVMDHGEGLGRLPQNVSSVSSLLLFNTSENPYKKYVILDPLGVVTKTRKEEVDEALPDAPSTIVQHEDMHRHTAENYSYMPGLGDVPEIAVPDFLPDLIGVADDLSYSQDLGPSIAPSVPTANIPELPEFTHDEALPAGPMSTQSENIPQPHEITIPPTAAPPPSPPPPPPPSVVPLPAPPPPPPPPPPTDIPEPPPSKSDVPKSAASLPSVDANKASLLESIRKAGGVGKVKLKSVKERKLAAKKQKQEEKDHGKQVTSQASGGDLMSDLTAKLLLRRKGISGTVKPDEKPTRDSLPNDSALNRVSAMIPPPPDDCKRTHDDDEAWK